MFSWFPVSAGNLKGSALPVLAKDVISLVDCNDNGESQEGIFHFLVKTNLHVITLPVLKDFMGSKYLLHPLSFYALQRIWNQKLCQWQVHSSSAWCKADTDGAGNRIRLRLYRFLRRHLIMVLISPQYLQSSLSRRSLLQQFSRQ